LLARHGVARCVIRSSVVVDPYQGKEAAMSAVQIVGQSAWARSLRENIAQVARYSSNVLVVGPSGTGKELIARTIHEQSPRARQPFVPVDCTSLTGELFASHLFGHVKGAFTGANHERLGCFRAAEGGTILLDEVGEISLELQAKLLRTIQERAVVPVGSDDPAPVDVRIIAATNRDLAAEVRAGRFRLDLYYRLNVVLLKTLPLAERLEEIEPLAAHFLAKIAKEQGFPHKRLTPPAIAALKSCPWPGNVRELQNVLERAAIFSLGDAIDAADIPREISTAPAEAIAQQLPPAASESELPTRPGTIELIDRWSTLADIEREHIRATLEHTFYNQSAAADLLNIDRASLARKIDRYGISIPPPRRGRPRKAIVLDLPPPN
jgi:DNA-binding NtrC family response regulator